MPYLRSHKGQIMRPENTQATENNENHEEVQASGSNNILTPPPGFQVRHHVNIQPFNGKEDAAQWWVMFLTFVQLQRMPEPEAILVLPFHLTGVAKQWYYMLSNDIKASLATIRDAFIKRFKPTVDKNIGLTNLSQKTTESIQEYIDRSTELNIDNSVSEQFLITLIENGLRGEYKNIIIPRRCKNLEEMREAGQIAELTIASSSSTSPGAIADTINSAVYSAVSACERKIMDSLGEKLDKTLSSISRHQQKPWQPNNHVNQSSQCGYCGKMDSEKCTTQITIGGVKTNALIDTGANISVIHQDFLRRTSYATTQYEKSENSSVIAANGNHVQILGKIKLCVTFGNSNFYTYAHVLPNLHHSVILGIDFLSETKAHLNFDSNTLEIKDENTVCCINPCTTGCGIARTVKAISLPKKSETIIEVSVSKQKQGATVFLEPLKNLEPNDILVARCIVKIENGKAFIRRVRANSPNTICMFLMILGLVYGGSAVPQEDIIQRINYGVVFKEQTQLYLAKESWLQTFKVALPQQEVLSNVQLCMPIDHAACHVANSMITYINNVDHLICICFIFYSYKGLVILFIVFTSILALRDVWNFLHSSLFGKRPILKLYQVS
ncbi:hypothetical protein KUTeg_002290 [Tegillarca granosa]|uniref:Peptidase A2 domain-containing protein n=1 Tax=Tegillarca granosa TaxID=220873 RepID=A0ABQ9FTW8_TEGGR|nr:hypothetical protein KUTeg_002290 [Tegillarca granosa]